MDASAECVKVTNNNRLTTENIKRILALVVERKAKVEHRSRLVHHDEIAENDYNLSVSTYVEQQDTREKVDIVKLEAELKEIVAKEVKLRAAIDKIVAELGKGGAR